MKYVLIILVIAVVAIFSRSRVIAEAKVEPAQAWKHVRSGALVVDVRTAEEFAGGHLEGALNIPFDKIAERVAELGSSKDRAIMLYCRSGRRSGIAQDTLKGLGFTNVLNGGGYEELKAAM